METILSQVQARLDEVERENVMLKQTLQTAKFEISPPGSPPTQGPAHESHPQSQPQPQPQPQPSPRSQLQSQLPQPRPETQLQPPQQPQSQTPTTPPADAAATAPDESSPSTDSRNSPTIIRRREARNANRSRTLAIKRGVTPSTPARGRQKKTNGGSDTSAELSDTPTPSPESAQADAEAMGLGDTSPPTIAPSPLATRRSTRQVSRSKSDPTVPRN